MINFVVGNLLESDAFALVNTVNCEGYMGKGIAYQFKLRFPEMNSEYVQQCKSHKLRPEISLKNITRLRIRKKHMRS